MNQEQFIAELKDRAKELYIEGRDKEYHELMAKIRKIEGTMNDNLICESCQ